MTCFKSPPLTSHDVHGFHTWTWVLTRGATVLGVVWRRRHDGPIVARTYATGYVDETTTDSLAAMVWIYATHALPAHVATRHDAGGLVLRHQWWPDDLAVLDQHAWYTLRKRVYDEVPPGLREDLLTRLRAARARQRLYAIAWNWETRYAGDREALHKHLARLVETTRAVCVDNYRVAKLGHHRGLLHFARAKARGCCGSAEKIVRVGWLPPRWYKIGFNHGH